jgi:hypothetical protein
MIALALLMAAAGADADPPSVVRLSARQMAAISRRCHSPPAWLRYDASGTLQIRPNRTAKYERVDCVLGQLKRLHAGPMGFVGNEAPQ